MIQFSRWNEATIEVIRDVCSLWNQELGNEFPISERLFIQNSFKCLHLLEEGSFIVHCDEKVVGLIISKVTREQVDLLPNKVGWIQVILVAKEHRRKGIVMKLLQMAEKSLRNCGVSKIVLGRDIHHYFPGIPSCCSDTLIWFEKQDYQYVNKVQDYYRSVSSGIKLLKTDLVISVLKEVEQGALLAFLHQSFPGRWEYEAIDYFRAGGDGRHFLVAKKEGKIIGFVRVNDTESPILGPNVYWDAVFPEKMVGIGPLGIDRYYRKNGYGKAIVEAAIQLAVERKAKHLVIDWTELDTFYKSFGFEVWKEYHQYEKILN
ncbi:GNAT family N-acetyltransferase [Pseudalkalibacillus decolorationis]|uniref:GNAT family N-acetyltransferase n=1 Tax=Pseudalkalibacillus decolorationis TaxID=163879 RepID=UPI0021473289|nr:GNAT family N-acetyltransferase [Pseudalkalibacillus decolorationis]